MYIVITENKVYNAKTLKGLEKSMKSKLEEIDFKRIGNTFICNMTNQDFDYVQDLNRLSNVALEKLYKKDNTKLFLILLLVFDLIIMIRI